MFAKFLAWLKTFFKVTTPLLPPAAAAPIKPAQPTPPPFVSLKKGDTGEFVSKMQTVLRLLGYTVALDGIFGDETETALKAFQKDNHIGQTGVLGPQTYAALDKARVIPQVPTPPASADEIVPDHTYASPNYDPSSRAKIDHIVLHNTEGTVSSAISRFMNSAEQVSAHYIIGRDGKVTKMVQEAYTAWHSGNWVMNHRSIGIEIEAGGGTGTGMTDVQHLRVIDSVKIIMKKYGVGIANILPHRDCVATSCPGSIWPNDDVFSAWKKAHLPN